MKQKIVNFYKTLHQNMFFRFSNIFFTIILSFNLLYPYVNGNIERLKFILSMFILSQIFVLIYWFLYKEDQLSDIYSCDFFMFPLISVFFFDPYIRFIGFLISIIIIIFDIHRYYFKLQKVS
mgnify:CR=1 FL=1